MSGIRIGTLLELTPEWARQVNRATILGLLVYVGVVLWISRAFLVAILGYLPAMVIFGAEVLMAYRREKKPAFLVGFLGICIMLLAAAVQQMQIDISARYFNYNALYHVLQGGGLFMVFVTARELCREPRNFAADA